MALGSAGAEVARPLRSMAWVCYRHGDYDQALVAMQRSLDISEISLGISQPFIADCVGELAVIYAAKSDHEQVLRLASRALAIHKNSFGKDDPRVTTSLYLLAMASMSMGDFQRCLSCWSDLFESLRQFQARHCLGLQDVQALESISRGSAYTEIYENVCLEIPEGLREKYRIVGAQNLSLTKALLEEVRVAQSAAESDPRQATKELMERYRAVSSRVFSLSEMNLYTTERDAQWREFQSQSREIETNLAERVRLVAQTIRERNLTLTDIARSLPPQSVLIDFIQYRRYDLAAMTNQWKESRYTAYLTFPLASDSTNVVVERVDLGEATPINEAVELVCKRMSAGQFAAKDLAPALQRLSDLVYAPLAAYLTNVSHLIVCPDGQLSRLPFEALPCGQNGSKFLIEEKTISYVTSGREIVRIASQSNSKLKTKNSKSLVMGNPDFNFNLGSSRREEALAKSSQLATNNSQPENQSLLTSAAARSLSRDYRGLKFDPLPGSGVEATNVAGLLGTDATLRLGADAREAELKAVVSPRVLHLATHGFYFPDQEFKQTNGLNNLDFTARRSFAPPGQDWENPLVRCGIALAGANHARQITNALAEDGLLTGLEASLLNLQGTELVILSACDSGTGEVKIGEGVMSLRRAFRIAGAESVLASHWPVNDKATSKLMTEFMRRWHSGEPRSQAWRAAQLSLLRSKDFSNRYFWAAFTLTGSRPGAMACTVMSPGAAVVCTMARPRP